MNSASRAANQSSTSSWRNRASPTKQWPAGPCIGWTGWLHGTFFRDDHKHYGRVSQPPSKRPDSVLRPVSWPCEEYPPKMETTNSLRISSSSSSCRIRENVPQPRSLTDVILSEEQIYRLCVAESVENGPSPVERGI